MANLQHLAIRTGYLAFALAISVTRAERGHAQGLWGDENSFPHRIVELALERAWSTPRARTADEIREKAAAYKTVNGQIEELVADVEGQSVRARLSVLSVNADEVRLLADATYGFPTRHARDIPTDEYLTRPQHSAVKLQETGVVAATKYFVLKVGTDIPADVAKQLRWNDKVIVTLRVDSVKLFPDVAMATTRDQYGLMSGVPNPNGTPAYCTVQVSGLRFVKADNSALVSSHRTWLWPGPGTLPFTLSLYSGNDGFGGLGLNHFTDYASLATFQGAALFEVKSLGKDNGFGLDESPLIAKDKKARVALYGANEFPRSQVAPELLRGLTHGKHFLLYFDANVEPGIGSSNSNWDGGIIRLTNVRVGTPDELADAERELERMAELGEQNQLAVQSEEALRMAQGPEAEEAPAEKSSGTDLSSIEKKLDVIDKKVTKEKKPPQTTPWWKQLNKGVYIGGGIAVLGVAAYAYLFLGNLFRRR